MSKFLLNLLVQISKAFVYSKIQILFGNNSSQISAHPAQPRPCRPASPSRPPCTHSAHLAYAALAYLPKGASSSSLHCPSTTFSLSRHNHVGPAHQFHPLPRTGRSKSCLHRASPHLIAPRLPVSIIEMLIKAPYSPTLIPPLESPLTTPRPSMASAVNHRPLLTGISTPSSPGPI
jgi:hypothetical protein